MFKIRVQSQVIAVVAIIQSVLNIIVSLQGNFVILQFMALTGTLQNEKIERRMSNIRGAFWNF